MDSPIPDTSKWQPREKAAETLSKAFYLRCQQAESSILSRVESEIAFNVDSYDSGSGVEDIIRQALSDLLPRRYAIRAGSLTDCLGRTSGDSEVVILNEAWFPSVKSGATPDSRRRCFPIEGVYGTIEVKQTLSKSSLDQAAEKLVKSSRLFRPTISNNYITENRILNNPTTYLSNPLFTGIIATRMDTSIDINDAVVRFIQINQTLFRTEMIRFLCVLGEFSAFWGYIPEDGVMRAATFQGEDLAATLIPAMASSESGKCPFYYLVSDLYAHCSRSILSPESLEVAYGLGTHNVSLAMNSELFVPPTHEHLETLGVPVVSQYIERKEGT